MPKHALNVLVIVNPAYLVLNVSNVILDII